MATHARAVRLPGGAFGGCPVHFQSKLFPALLNVSCLWPLVSIQGRRQELPEASDGTLLGGSKVEVVLASTHSLFDGATRN